MKKITAFLPIVAMAMMVGCSKDADLSSTGQPNTGDGLSGAYVSLSIVTPTSRAGAGDSSVTDTPQNGEVAGTLDESAVSKVAILVFDKNYKYIGRGETTTIGANGSGLPQCTFEVAPDAYRFFVLANPTEKMEAALTNISGNWNTVEASLQTILTLESNSEVATYATAGAFPMVNAGSYANNMESVLVHPSDSELVNGKISTDKSNPTAVNIRIDRMVAKFTVPEVTDLKVSDLQYTAGNTNADGYPKGSIDGVRLNVVNKKSYIYSHIKSVNINGDDYRADPNMSVANTIKDITDNFFWLHNYENTVFKTPGADYAEYVFENEAAGGEFFNYNNLTQLVVKATYIPSGQGNPPGLPSGYDTVLEHDELNDKGSWFAVDLKIGENNLTMQMTLAGLKSYYTKLGEEVTGADGSTYPADTDTQDKMNIQLRHMLKSAKELNGISVDELATITWADDRVTCKVLNSIPNGGYVAATVPAPVPETPENRSENYIVQFYQFGLNYYDIFIQHDRSEDIGHLGRWGMVRNNMYSLSIKSISGAGLPYIPDPTDPEIKDPQNPDPKDPEPADPNMGQIEATIEVNPWTLWTQDVDLNN